MEGWQASEEGERTASILASGACFSIPQNRPPMQKEPAWGRRFLLMEGRVGHAPVR